MRVSDLRERSADGVQADLSIRGSTFAQTLVLLNGLRMVSSLAVLAASARKTLGPRGEKRPGKPRSCNGFMSVTATNDSALRGGTELARLHELA
jgi:hypothetical protein